MNQTAKNRATLARALNGKATTSPQLSAEGLRRKAFAKNFAQRDLMDSIALHGTRRVSNSLLIASILETAAHKFNAMKGQK